MTDFLIGYASGFGTLIIVSMSLGYYAARHPKVVFRLMNRGRRKQLAKRNAA